MTGCRDCQESELKAEQQNGVISSQLELIAKLRSHVDALKGTLRDIRNCGRRALAMPIESSGPELVRRSPQWGG